MKKYIAALLLIFFTLNVHAESVARQWNRMILSAVRKDYARPTVTARNLFHLSIIAYDGWAMYDPLKKNYFYDKKHPAQDIEKARRETITAASYDILIHRYAHSPNFPEVKANALALAKALGVDVESPIGKEGPLANGHRLGQMVIDNWMYDGSLEELEYQSPPDIYVPINPPMIVKQPGVGELVDVNFWQPLALDQSIDQGGNPIPNNIQSPLTLHWGQVRPFALVESDKNPSTHLYFDPGAPPQWSGEGHQTFVDSMVQVIEYSSWLSPDDAVKIDISPASMGNNIFGTNSGQGYALNPKTNKKYLSQIVPRADFARVLAEFWADGPQSETPPGHWNVVANQASDHPLFVKKWMGQGKVLDDLEWDVKMYLTLNGALHDAAITAWGLKGYYQSGRPISAIRYLATQGLPLQQGLIELITLENTNPGEKMASHVGHEGELALRAWRGNPAEGEANKGVGWILASQWLPYQKATFVTPPFPGYVSGHSTFSRAAAEVLTAISGDPFFPGGVGEYHFKKNEYLTFEKGPSQDITLQWATYYDAADQSAISRIFGGIHGSLDDIPGRKIGRIIGRRAVARANGLF